MTFKALFLITNTAYQWELFRIFLKHQKEDKKKKIIGNFPEVVTTFYIYALGYKTFDSVNHKALNRFIGLSEIGELFLS